jgi:hypothetical protein
VTKWLNVYKLHICFEHSQCRKLYSSYSGHRLRVRWAPSRVVSRHWVLSHCALLVQGVTACSTARVLTTAATPQLCATTVDVKWIGTPPSLALRCEIQCCTFVRF